MATRVRLQIARQPDHAACGPTCLHAIYRYYGDSISLARVVREVRRLRNGGTLAVCLGNHALSRGYRVRIHTYDLQVWDPTWFRPGVSPAE
jgi:ABC-type bacteriocin/lantibiotic exporter with double-glycine peptidase domain